MKTLSSTAIVAVLGLTTWACSSSGYGTAPSTTSSSPAPSPAGIVTVNVVAINGAQSFSPNPATLPAGQKVVWHNIDSVTHRVVLNDGAIDTGNLAPGASSSPMTIGSAGGAYHCSIHPEMIGSINQDTPTPSTSAPTPY
jgi:plastocyanin